ncbi:MAG: SusD/RagB family nutrient-binding outer membrane lipoprotein [Flavobacteriaceae bacterium]
MKNITKYAVLVAFGGLLTLASCESTELNLRDNPNALTPEQASVDFFLNSIQEDFVRQFEGDADNDNNDNFGSGGVADGFSAFGMDLTRMMNMAGRNYASVYNASDMDDEWTNCYRGVLADIRAAQPLIDEQGLAQHLAINQFIEAYLMLTMVDMFGDVPYTEAIKAGELNFNPAVDSAESIYAAMEVLIDQAIANFNAQAVGTPPDPFYGNDYELWIRACNTLKLKIYIQTRLVDSSAQSKFLAIIGSGNYIQDTSQDFQWLWPASNASQPDTRHPRFGINYTATGGQEYFANHLMFTMDQSADPRTRYYFYRQTAAVPGAEIPPDEVTLNCSLQTPPQHYVDGGFPFCFLPNGYWGRDHGDNEGIPPDGLLRVLPGVYPFGGTFDDDSFTPQTPTSGAGGSGVTVLLSAFNVDFWLAEWELAGGNAPGARDNILAGFDKSIAKVQAFLMGRLGTGDDSFEPSAADITAYRDAITAAFDAGSNDDQWNILGEQFIRANYGNGVEPYNFYRRTNYPDNLKPNREPDPSTFITSMYYPNNAVNRNQNISQKATQSEPVFWDTSGLPPAN